MINTMVTDLETSIDRELETTRISSVEDIREAGRALANFSPAMAEQVRELKALMHQRLYHHYRVSRMTEKAGRVLARLFETYLAEPRQMPPHVLARTADRRRFSRAGDRRLYRWA